MAARFHRLLLPPLAFLILFPFSTRGQTFTVGTSSLHDENIFDIYLPTSDQITQVELQAAEDWDFDQASLTASYEGSGQFFRDLPARNYHLHLLSFSALYHVETGDEDGEADSADGNADSARTLSNPAAIVGGTPIHSDSADRFLLFALTGASQFDRDIATSFGNPIVHDNWSIDALASMRQPAGIRFSFRPWYLFSVHVYPNVSAISNLQQSAGVTLGSDLLKGSWIALTPAYAFKNYTGSSTFTDTVRFRRTSGHGKGFGFGNGGVRESTFVFTTPSVNQFIVSLTWKQTITPGSVVSAGYTHFGAPSGEARILPAQLGGTPGDRGVAGSFTADDEIFDDHFAYSADGLGLQLNQSLPFGFKVVAAQHFQQKTYSAPAMDLADSLTLASHRDDRRTETDLTLSLPIALGPGKTLTPEAEYHHVRNDSNAPYYAFDKSVILLGISFEF
jgi:surface lipoprotein assembly modifier-like protein